MGFIPHRSPEVSGRACKPESSAVDRGADSRPPRYAGPDGIRAASTAICGAYRVLKHTAGKTGIDDAGKGRGRPTFGGGVRVGGVRRLSCGGALAGGGWSGVVRGSTAVRTTSLRFRPDSRAAWVLGAVV